MLSYFNDKQIFIARLNAFVISRAYTKVLNVRTRYKAVLYNNNINFSIDIFLFPINYYARRIPLRYCPVVMRIAAAIQSSGPRTLSNTF